MKLSENVSCDVEIVLGAETLSFVFRSTRGVCVGVCVYPCVTYGIHVSSERETGKRLPRFQPSGRICAYFT